MEERPTFNRVVVGSIPTSGGEYHLYTHSCNQGNSIDDIQTILDRHPITTVAMLFLSCIIYGTATIVSMVYYSQHKYSCNSGGGGMTFVPLCKSGYVAASRPWSVAWREI